MNKKSKKFVIELYKKLERLEKERDNLKRESMIRESLKQENLKKRIALIKKAILLYT